MRSRSFTAEERERVTPFEAQYTRTYNTLLSHPDREVTVRGFGRGDSQGSCTTAAGAMGEALEKRQVLYAPSGRQSGSMMQTLGGPGEGSTPVTFVFDRGLRAGPIDIAHEIGLHGTPAERMGGLQ